MSFTKTEDCEPPKNVLLECLLSDGKSTSKLVFDGKLYWAGDMYVYYIPMAWRLA